jgi:hypothetical protein
MTINRRKKAILNTKIKVCKTKIRAVQLEQEDEDEEHDKDSKMNRKMMT